MRTGRAVGPARANGNRAQDILKTLPNELPEPQKGEQNRENDSFPCRHPLFERANSKKRTEQKAQIKRHRGHIVSFGKFLAPPQGRAPESTVVQHVAKTSFEVFTATPQ